MDHLLVKQKFHIDQLMKDERVKKLVQHVADHAYSQGHVRSEHEPGTCEECAELIKSLFPNSDHV